MSDHIKIICAAAADRDTLVTILARNGYTVRQGREKRGKGSAYTHYITWSFGERGPKMPEYIERGVILEEIRTVRNQLLLGKAAAAKLEKMVKAAPAADVEPVRHGRWIDEDGDGMHLLCSNCGYEMVFSYEGGRPEDGDLCYCSACGAKMDKPTPDPPEGCEKAPD